MNERGVGIRLLVGLSLYKPLLVNMQLDGLFQICMLQSTDKWHALAYCLSADT